MSAIYSYGEPQYLNEEKTQVTALNRDKQIRVRPESFTTSNTGLANATYNFSISISGVTGQDVDLFFLGAHEKLVSLVGGKIRIYDSAVKLTNYSEYGEFSGGVLEFTVVVSGSVFSKTQKTTLLGVENTQKVLLGYGDLYLGAEQTENLIYDFTNYKMEKTLSSGTTSEYNTIISNTFQTNIQLIAASKYNFNVVGSPAISKNTLLSTDFLRITSSSKDDYCQYVVPHYFTESITQFILNSLRMDYSSEDSALEWTLCYQVVGWLEVYVSRLPSRKVRIKTINGSNEATTDYEAINSLNQVAVSLLYESNKLQISSGDLFESSATYYTVTNFKAINLKTVDFRMGALNSDSAVTQDIYINNSNASNTFLQINSGSYIWSAHDYTIIPKVYKGPQLIYGTATTPKFIATHVANGNKTMSVSADGFTWELIPSPYKTVGTHGVAYGNGTWVITGYGPNLLIKYSTDGVTWKNNTSNAASSEKVFFSNGYFFTKKYNTDNDILRSTDGITWTTISKSDSTMGPLWRYNTGAFFPDRLVWSNPTSGDHLWYTTDGGATVGALEHGQGYPPSICIFEDYGSNRAFWCAATKQFTVTPSWGVANVQSTNLTAFEPWSSNSLKQNHGYLGMTKMSGNLIQQGGYWFIDNGGNVWHSGSDSNSITSMTNLGIQASHLIQYSSVDSNGDFTYKGMFVFYKDFYYLDYNDNKILLYTAPTSIDQVATSTKPV